MITIILMMCQYGILKISNNPILSSDYQILLSDATNIVVSVLMMSFLVIIMTFMILITIEKKVIFIE